MVRASKRAGEFVTLSELAEEVGIDACRYFFLARSPATHMEFDLELAKRESADNPVYYVQYAHARNSGILSLARSRGIDWSLGDVTLLNHPSELSLIRAMLRFPELVAHMARTLEPPSPAPLYDGVGHGFPLVLRELPGDFIQSGRPGLEPGPAEAGGIGPDRLPPFAGIDGHERPGADVTPGPVRAALLQSASP